MSDTELGQLLGRAKEGNEWVRERLIRRYKPYIINTVGHVCKRYITWSDEESSIGLLAFNRAINTYEPTGGRTFISYAYLLIYRDLVDFFRQEKREKHMSLNYTNDQSVSTATNIEVEQSLESYKLSSQSTELIEEILELNQLLTNFDICFEELEGVSPKHKETRCTLVEMANDFVKDQELVDHLLNKYRFPTTAFTKKKSYQPKTIERFRKYLITLVVLLLHPEWKQLSSFIQDLSRNEGS